MAWRYETSYTVGRDNRRICRRLEGFEALCAIGFDLMLSLVFALVGFFLRLAGCILAAATRFVLELARVPLRALRLTLHRYSPKPTWAGFEEL